MRCLLADDDRGMEVGPVPARLDQAPESRLAATATQTA